MPLILPIMVILAALGGVLGLLAGAVWAGSRGGRARIQVITKPVMEKMRNHPEVCAGSYINGLGRAGVGGAMRGAGVEVISSNDKQTQTLIGFSQLILHN